MNLLCRLPPIWTLIVGAEPGNWSLWTLFDNVWSFAGSDSEDINLFNFQYQFQAYGQAGYNIVRPDDEEASRRGRLARDTLTA